MHSRLLFTLALAACTAADGRTDVASAVPADTAVTKAFGTGAIATPENDSLLQRADLGRIMGSPDAKVWMIIVSDFECPYCREWHASVAPALRKQYVETGKVRFAYLNFPLTQHQHAWPAAEVAMCAGAQGKFWPVHDAIFETQRTWVPFDPVTSAAYFDSIAVARGTDAAKLRACVSSRVLRPLIQADYDRSRKTGVGSTPTIIIGEVMMPGVFPLADYRAQLDSALAKAAPAKKD